MGSLRASPRASSSVWRDSSLSHLRRPSFHTLGSCSEVPSNPLVRLCFSYAHESGRDTCGADLLGRATTRLASSGLSAGTESETIRRGSCSSYPSLGSSPTHSCSGLGRPPNGSFSVVTFIINKLNAEERDQNTIQGRIQPVNGLRDPGLGATGIRQLGRRQTRRA